MATITQVIPARVLSLSFARAYFTTMRPYLLFISGITGLVGVALGPEIPLGETFLFGMIFFLSYGFGQALTDCFQLDTDRISSPYRPLVRGMIRRRDVMAVSLTGLLLGGLVLAWSHSFIVPLAIAEVAGLATYTHFKRQWWAGPFYNAWIVAVLLVIGYVASVGAARGTLIWPTGLGWSLVAVFFGYANFVLTGYFKDTAADRATGYDTLPVRYGFRVSTWVSDLFALLTFVGVCGALVSALWGGALLIGHWITLLLAAAGVGTSLLAQRQLHRVMRDSQAHLAITPVVHAYILLLGAVATAYKPGWGPGLVVFYAVFWLALKARPMKAQI